MTSFDTAFKSIHDRVEAAARQAGTSVQLLAVSKTKPADAVRSLAALGQRAFGENYVQEALSKQRQLSGLCLQWHLIGPLQSNKCRDVAQHFDWLQSLDRIKLVPLLDRARPDEKPPLNVLIQVNIDDEASKSGCHPDEVGALAEAVAAAPHLRLRGLMAIPEPTPDMDRRREAFSQMRALFQRLHGTHRDIDTLSMGMSDDFELAIAQGATLVRIGTALFGARR